MQPQPLTAGMRSMLWIAGVLVLMVGTTLTLLTEQTETFFAWTIQSNLTAAFLGASYLSACAVEFSAARERLWANARVAVPAVLIFTALTLVVTLVHRDRFHWDAPLAFTRAGTWFWLAVYALVPVALGVLWVLQERVPGSDPAVVRPLHPIMRALLVINAALMLPIGAVLLLAPELLIGAWPWPLTPLTGRAIGAWLLGLGVAAAHAAREGDVRRVQPVAYGGLAFALFQTIALLRFGGEINWGQPLIAFVLFVVVTLGITGVYSVAALRRS